MNVPVCVTEGKIVLVAVRVVDEAGVTGHGVLRLSDRLQAMGTLPGVPRLDERIAWTFIFAITGLSSGVPTKDEGFTQGPLLGRAKNDAPLAGNAETQGLSLRGKTMEESM